MKLVVIVLTMASVASAAAPAFGDEEGAGMNRFHGRSGPKKTAEPAVKANDKDYKAALDRVPPPTQKYDPWGTMRPANDKH